MRLRHRARQARIERSVTYTASTTCRGACRFCARARRGLVSLRRAFVGLAVGAVFGVGFIAPAFAAASSLTLGSPVPGSVTNHARLTFSGTATDAGPVIVHVYSGPTASGTPVLFALTSPIETPSGAWSAAATSSAPADGMYTAQAEQQLAGGLVMSGSSTFIIDTTGPGVTLTGPANLVRKGDPTPTFSGAAGNERGDSGAVFVQVYAGTGTGGPLVETVAATRSGGSWSVGAAPSLGDGTYTARAIQGDDVGNIGVGNTSTFTIDTTAPSVTLDTPAANGAIAGTRPTFRGSAGTASGDLPTVRVNIYRGTGTRGAPVQSRQTTQSSGSWSVRASALARGTYTVRAEQIDDLGHRGVSDTHTFTVGARAAQLLSPFPIVHIAGRLTGRGATLRFLTVEAPAGSRVEVRCRGEGCPRRRQSHVAPGRAGAKGLRLVTFPRFARALRAGVVLEIRITRSGRIGKYTRFVIRRNKSPRRTDSCLMPGKSKPTACPTS
jgi:Big-like domain-containing protein